MIAQADGATALVLACQLGHAATAEILMQRGANVEQAAEGGFRPLHLACQGGHERVVTLLIERG